MTVTTSTAYGRQSVLWPDFNHVMGTGLHAKIVDSLAFLSDQIVSRQSEDVSLPTVSNTFAFVHNLDVPAVAALKIQVWSVEDNAFLTDAEFTATFSVGYTDANEILITRIATGFGPTFRFHVGYLALVGMTSLNGLTAAAQTLVAGSAGTDFNIVSFGSSHTINIPDASASARGLINTGAQTIAGAKTFTSQIDFGTTGATGRVRIFIPNATSATELFNIERGDGLNLYSIDYDSTSPGTLSFVTDTKNYVWKNGPSGAETMRISSAGNVGIGTTSPDKGVLHINTSSGTTTFAMQSASGADSRIAFFEGTNATPNFDIIYAGSAGTGTNNRFRMRASSDSASEPSVIFLEATQAGAVTLGPSGAGSLSHVINGSNVTQQSATFAQHQIDSAGGTDALLLFSESGGTAGQWAIGKDNSNSDALDISAGGTLGSNSVGIITRAGAWTLGPTTNDQSHIIRGRAQIISATGIEPIDATANTTTTTDVIVRLRSDVGGSDITKWRVEADGDTISSTGSYTSDLRAKKNVTPIHYGLAEILQLDPMSYNWKHDPDQEIKSFSLGSAQKIQEIMPEMVRDDGLEDGEGGSYKSVYEKEVMAVVVKAIQELNAKIEALGA